MTAAVKVSGLGKAYRVWQHPSDMLFEVLAFKRRHAEFQALADVSFEVLPGSVIGIMGRNGAGKSTLLRIIAGTLNATEGTVEVKGRVAAILELGTGFSPEYTGRENIYLGGMCLGLKRPEIKRRLDEIISFAEVGEFIDRPFRTFSSGMQARLTFAVATCVDPDILIIDEALAVGDARFQVKSFDRVREFKRRGKSILLVSHDMNQIASVCDRAIVLERGRVVADGLPQQVCNIYHKMLFSPKEVVVEAPREEPREHVAAVASHASEIDGISRTSKAGLDDEACRGLNAPSAAIAERSDGPDQYRYGDGTARIVGARIATERHSTVGRLKCLETYYLVCRIQAMVDVGPSILGWVLRDKRGLDLFGWDMQTGDCAPIPPLAAGEEHEVAVAFRANLGAGSYFVTVALARPDGHKLDLRFELLEIAVFGSPEIFTTSIAHLEPRLVRSTRLLAGSKGPSSA
jgi:lipopolysaccharide transport system ATP-binding protein